MLFSLHELPESLSIKLFEKLGNKQLVRFRKTCRFVHELVEKHRFHLSTHRPSECSLRFCVANDFSRHNSIPRPYEQLSAFRLVSLYIVFVGEVDEKVAEESLATLKRLNLSVHHVHIGKPNDSHVDIEKWILATKFQTLHIDLTEKYNFEKIASIPSVANCKNIAFDINNWDSLPSNGLLRPIKESKSECIRFYQMEEVSNANCIVNLIKEIVDSDFIANCLIGFVLLRSAFKPSIYTNGFCQIFRSVPSQHEYTSVYGLPLKKKFLIMIVYESGTDYQRIDLEIIEKTISALEKKLIKCTRKKPDTRVLEHIFESLVQ